MGLIYAQCILGNFQYGGDHDRCGTFVFFANSLKEYEIIMLIYKIKTCRLDLLCFCAPEDIII